MVLSDVMDDRQEATSLHHVSRQATRVRNDNFDASEESKRLRVMRHFESRRGFPRRACCLSRHRRPCLFLLTVFRSVRLTTTSMSPTTTRAAPAPIARVPSTVSRVGHRRRRLLCAPLRSANDKTAKLCCTRARHGLVTCAALSTFR